MAIETYRNQWQISRSSQYELKNLQTDVVRRAAYTHSPQDLIICGQKFGPECHRQLNEKKKQQWSIEKPKPHNARKLRGFCFIDPDERSSKKPLNSLSHHNFEHKFIPMLQAMTILDAKAAVNKEWEKLEKLPAWQMTKVKSKKEVIKNCEFCHADEHLSSSECGVRTDISRDKSRHSEVTKWMTILARMRCSQSNGRWNFPSQHVQIPTTAQVAQIMVEHRRSSDSSWTRSVWSPNCQPLVKETLCISSIETRMGKSTELGMPRRASNARSIYSRR